MKWRYGITTVPTRFNTTFQRTLDSLRSTGFDKPHIFVDGKCNRDAYEALGLDYVTVRDHPSTPLGNWVMSLWEIYLHEPLADRYAIFQDDVIFVRNLKAYIEQIPLPDDRYWNLFSFMKDNETLLNPANYGGFLKASNFGRGALALVFPRSAVVSLLSARSMVMKPQTANKRMASKRIDGGIVTALSPLHKQQQSHWEYIHNPSLVQHIGDVSSIGNHNQPKALSFPGEEFDALSFLERRDSMEALKEIQDSIPYSELRKDLGLEIGRKTNG